MAPAERVGVDWWRAVAAIAAAVFIVTFLAALAPVALEIDDTMSWPAQRVLIASGLVAGMAWLGRRARV